MDFVATSPASPRYVYWVKTLGKFISAQLIVQAVGVASGILLVRTLDQREYAYFTIAFAMHGTMNLLADSGIGIGLSSIGGRVWQDRHRLGQLINTALRLRRYLAVAAIAVVTPILLWMLTSNGASFAYAGLITFIVILNLNFQIMTGVLLVVPRLHSQIGRLQAVDLLGAFSRLALLLAAYLIFLNAAVAVLAALVATLAQYFLLGRLASNSIDRRAPVNEEYRTMMVEIVKSYIPNAIFYSMQGQLTIWLIAIFGDTQNIAEVGALGRLSVIFSVIGAVMSSVVLPSFARCQSPDQLRRRYFQIVAAFCLFGISFIAVAQFFPDQLLWILGPKYSHLRDEVVLMMALASFSSVISAMWLLNATKAWIKYVWLNIPSVILTQVLLLSLFNVSTLNGVLWFSILSLVPTFLINSGLSYRGLNGRDTAPISS
jgi:O-antigen/teichoic acid export membrane protein